ncbi:hypothetical protein D3C73_1358990 [compost metagenome]
MVTNRSSPTSCTFLPMRSVSSFQPAQSFSARPSSMVMIGYCAAQSARKSTNCSEVRRLFSPTRLYLPFSKNSLEATSRPSSTSSPAV